MTSRPILARWAIAVALLAAVLPSAAFGIAQRPAGTRAVRQAMPAQVPHRSEQVAGIVLVKFKDSSAPAVRRTLTARGVSASALPAATRRGISAVRIPKGRTAAAFVAELKADSNVAVAAPDFKRYPVAYLPPNDPAYNDSATYSNPDPNQARNMVSSYGKSWWLRDLGVNAAAAWQHGFSDPSARNFPVRAPASTFKVAVLDTGFYMNHPDKGPNIVAGIDEFGYRTPSGDLATDTDVTPPVADSSVSSDPREALFIVSHGTCTAGEVAAATRNDEGVASAGYDAEVVVYKVMGKDLDPSSQDYQYVYIDDQALINAIYDATDAGCKVISMSLGGDTDSPLFQNAVNYAWGHGVAILAATGNNPTAPVLFPAADDNVVGVGSYSVDDAGRFRSDFTSYLLNHPPAKQNGVDILAPGEMIWGLIKPDYQSFLGGGVPGYEFWAGTSMATPAAAGALAHMWRYQPSFTNQQIIDYLEHHAAPEGTNPNIGYGWGYLDMSLVMDGLMSDYPYLHAPALTTPATVPVGPNFITWNAVTGHSVVYNVSVDGFPVATSAGTWAGVTLAEGSHTYAVQATSLFDWYDGSSTSTGTILADPTAVATAPDSWGGFQPAGWVNTRTVPVSVQARDATSGLLLGTAECRSSSNGGSTWTGWSPASFSYAGGPTATQTISAAAHFTQDSTTSDQVEFRVTNAASLVGTSPAFPVQVDTIAPTGTFTVAGGLPTVPTATVSVESSVTDVNLYQMRFSGDTAAPWTTWLPYSADATITLPPGRVMKTVRAEYRDKALNVLARSRTITLSTPPAVVRRVAGYNRYDTAIQISRAHFATGTADTLVVATGENFPDALSAAALAGSYSAPLLLTPTNTLWSGIPGEISRLGATQAIIVGGPTAVSARVQLDLDALPGVSVKRFKGDDRYATSAAIAVQVEGHELSLGHGFANEAFLARGDAFPDALAASPFAFEKRIPILLVKPTSIPPVIWTEIGTLMPNVSTAHLVVCGGTGAVGSGVTNQLTGAGRKWLRVGSPPGGTRYDTAAAMAAYGVGQGWATWQFVGVATGEDFPDALGGGVAAGKMGGLVLLTQTAPASPACVNALRLQTFFVDELDVFGGTTAVSAAAYNTIHGLF